MSTVVLAMFWLRAILPALFSNLILVFARTCEDDSCTDIISMPILDGLKATLRADLDVANMNKHLSAYIQQEVKIGIGAAMKDTMQALIEEVLEKANSTISSITQRKLEEEMDRPVFYVSLKSHPYVLKDIDAILKFDDVRINRGDGYNPSTGIFTAPRNGLYQISCVILAGQGSQYVQFQLNKNEDSYSGGLVDSSDNHGTQTLSSVLDLKKDDRVFIKHRAYVTQQVFGRHYSSFSGHFIQS